MKKKKFIKKKKKSYLVTKKNEIKELKEKLNRAKVFQNGNILWKDVDDDMNYIKSLDNLQSSLDMDWNDWVLMCPEFSDFSEEEQEEIRNHELFLSTPVNVWNL